MKKVNGDDLLNGWLKKYHNTTVEEVAKNYPPEVIQSPKWFKLFPVTQQEHDEWEKWALDYIRGVTRLSKRAIAKGWPLVYLDTAPYVKPE
jgi:hypothetical protein